MSDVMSADDTPPSGYSSDRGPDGHFLPLVQGVVEATGAGVGRGYTGDDPLPVQEAGEARAKRIEAAMTAAIEQAMDDGITDPDAMRERILAARDKAVEGD